MKKTTEVISIRPIIHNRKRMLLSIQQTFGKTLVYFMLLLLVSCSNESDAPVVLAENTAGFLRTVGFVNSDLVLGDTTGVFGLNLEVNDEDNGNLLESVDVFIQFKEKALGDQNNIAPEVLIKTIAKEQFALGPDGLPRTLLNLTYSEMVEAMSVADLRCGDQFLVRLKLNLNNGKSFSSDGGNSPEVIGFDTTISSPFCYTVNIVNAMPEEQFIGLYTYESVIDGLLGPTFGLSKTVELKRGNSINDRYFEGDYIASRSNEPSRKFRFIFGCGEVLFRKNQISSFFTWCPEGNLSGGITFGGPPILLGPGDEAGITSIDDDSFFELYIQEGYSGWDGECGIGTVNAKVRFTKVGL